MNTAFFDFQQFVMRPGRQPPHLPAQSLAAFGARALKMTSNPENADHSR